MSAIRTARTERAPKPAAVRLSGHARTDLDTLIDLASLANVATDVRPVIDLARERTLGDWQQLAHQSDHCLAGTMLLVDAIGLMSRHGHNPAKAGRLRNLVAACAFYMRAARS